MLSFQQDKRLPCQKQQNMAPQKRVHFGSSGGLGDIWADLRPGPDPSFLDGIQALLRGSCSAHRAAGQNFIAAKWRVRKY